MDQPVAPSVSFADVQAAIVGETYTVLPNGKTTICQLTLDNGFTVEGSSACVSLENFDPIKGQHYARKKAEDKVWEHLGFRLADKLHNAAQAALQGVQTAYTVDTDPAYPREIGPSKPVEMGDQVFYYERLALPTGDSKLSDPMLATVAAILPGNHLALSVLAPNGTSHARTNVPLVQPWMATPEVPGFARPK
jgi:hypothetical protein